MINKYIIAKQMWHKCLHRLNLGVGIWAAIVLASEVFELLNIYLKYLLSKEMKKYSWKCGDSLRSESLVER